MDLRFKLPLSYIKGLKITAIEILISFFSGFISSIIVARSISVDEFGVFVFANAVFILFFKLNNFGFNVLIMRSLKTHNSYRLEFSEIFWVNFLLSLVLVALSLIFASLTQAIELGIAQCVLLVFTLFLNSLSGIYNAHAWREKLFSFMSAINIVKALIVVILTFMLSFAFGNVYLIVIPHLVGALLVFLIMYLRFPGLIIIGQLRVGWFLSGLSYLYSSFLEEVQNRSNEILISILFGSEILGFYARAMGLLRQIYQSAASVFHRVAFPFITQSAIDHSKNIMKFQFLLVTLILHPCLYILDFIADDIIALIYGPKWSVSVDYVGYGLTIGYCSLLYFQFKSYIVGIGNIKTSNLIDLSFLILVGVAFFLCDRLNFGVKNFLLVFCLINLFISLLYCWYSVKGFGLRFSILLTIILTDAVLLLLTGFYTIELYMFMFLKAIVIVVTLLSFLRGKNAT